jgi:hypothetical protein
LQALPEDIALHKNRYQVGWDEIRKERLARMKKLGIVDCSLSPLETNTVPRWNLTDDELHRQISTNEVGRAVAWDSLTEGQKDFQAAKMAIHAAMVHRMDLEIGRVLDQIKAMGALDNTLIFFVPDNGASSEQILRGDGNDPSAPLGSAPSYLGLGSGWSSAANTPFRLHKSWTHEGGITTPLIVSWPAGIKSRGELRRDPGHLIDLVPTVLDVTSAKRPAEVGGGCLCRRCRAKAWRRIFPATVRCGAICCGSTTTGTARCGWAIGNWLGSLTSHGSFTTCTRTAARRGTWPPGVLTKLWNWNWRG